MKITMLLFIIITFFGCGKPSDGSNGSDGRQGSVGQSGTIGTQGPAGPQGIQGAQGVQGPTGAASSNSALASMLNPCGATTGLNDEVLVQFGHGNPIMRLYNDMDGVRFIWLKPGNYSTHDARTCYFTIDSTNTMTNEHF